MPPQRWLDFLSEYPDVLRWRGSVWPSILPSVLTMGLFATLIAVLYLHFGFTKLSLPNAVIPSLSVVLGLLLAFRANTSYARFYEGRQIWEQITSNSRNLARLVWCAIPERTQSEHLEKMRCMKLLLAFAVATKHHIRKEMGCNYYDLDHLLPPNWIPAAANDKTQYPQAAEDTSQSPAAALFASTETTSQGPLANQTGDNPDDPATGHRPVLFRKFVSDEDLPDEADADMSLPLEIVFRIGLYIAQMKNTNRIDGNIVGTITTHLNNLIDCLGSLERIVNTPIPRAYNIHLKQGLALYLLAVPFTLIADLKWWIIPTVILVSFTLFGIEGIGAQIENPFMYSSNDLPLNQFCDQLRKEIEYIIYHIPSETENVLMHGR
ncbi:hypothetical protein K450DRAFT_263031 [Umbelopsis ramanniana AG]|uniref:Uncharacterized protein n=1 Tax=Umbelopsis ramanniana AG TaxID=1314678 RepID=A0AAD5DZ41_UMBRA|nr:uncharacterized protein K450DRAFT_263031 [Umbelopsis ramanniana AG]KAI8575173.1 hypothetical protein K450DRAFT_263031 [Umbelopsis ramanniana AG]